MPSGEKTKLVCAQPLTTLSTVKQVVWKRAVEIGRIQQPIHPPTHTHTHRAAHMHAPTEKKSFVLPH